MQSNICKRAENANDERGSESMGCLGVQDAIYLNSLPAEFAFSKNFPFVENTTYQKWTTEWMQIQFLSWNNSFSWNIFMVKNQEKLSNPGKPKIIADFPEILRINIVVTRREQKGRNTKCMHVLSTYSQASRHANARIVFYNISVILYCSHSV